MSPEYNPARHDREGVARLALSLLDEVGLADLSMRRIAARLDVQPSALYWHFDNKQELLAAVADLITAGIPDRSSSVLDTARGIRDALFAYRDGAELALSTYALRLGTSHAQTVLESALRGEGHPDAADRAAAVLHFILGHAALVQQRMHAESHGAARDGGMLDTTTGLERIFDLGVQGLAEPAGTVPFPLRT